jgi:hypothetical protein
LKLSALTTEPSAGDKPILQSNSHAQHMGSGTGLL